MTVDAAAVRPEGSPSAATPRYRPDVDGLRAVAIALVVAFHFGVPGATGGYLGVDLFFVISGFLIASIFERQPLASWSDAVVFYARRLKRLMPAFVFVAAVVCVVAAVLLLPDDFESFLRGIRDSLGFTANRYFERETTGYFAANATELPWLHTWSLSVEWQFYFAFPIVLALLRMLPARRLRTIALASLCVVGAAWSIGSVAIDPAQAYFSASARFFEFLLGALGATIAPKRPDARSLRWLSSVGVAALVGLAFFFDASTAFPGVGAVVVCLVGLGLIVTGPEGSVLARAGLPWVGRRSYSIYLWHWPVVAFCNYVQYRMPAAVAAGAIAVVVMLAMATYRFVERPGMSLSWKPVKTFAVWWLAPFACAAIAFLVVHRFEGFPQRLGPEAMHAWTNTKRFATHRYDRCHDGGGDDLERCAFGDVASTTTALLIGDSHARHFRPFLQVLAEEAHVKVYGLTNSECMTLDGAVSARPRQIACVPAIARDYALIRERRFRYVILAERWIGYPPDELAGLDRSLAAIVASGAVPMLFEEVAEDGTNPRDCFYRHVKTRSPAVDDCSIREGNGYATRVKEDFRELVDRMRLRYPSLIVIDPQSVQCEDGSCRTVIDATPMYSDLHHLSEFGSTMLARAYRVRFGNPWSAGSAAHRGKIP